MIKDNSTLVHIVGVGFETIFLVIQGIDRQVLIRMEILSDSVFLVKACQQTHKKHQYCQMWPLGGQQPNRSQEQNHQLQEKVVLNLLDFISGNNICNQ